MPTSIPRPLTPYTGMHLARHGWKCYYTRDYKRKYKCLATKDKEEAARRKDQFYALLLRRGAVYAGTPEARKPKKRIRITKTEKPWYGYVDNRYVGRYATHQDAAKACARRLRELGGEPEPQEEPETEDEYV